jgi:hypothetical protein
MQGEGCAMTTPTPNAANRDDDRTPIEKFLDEHPEFANAPIVFWACPNEAHRDKGIVDWRGDVAYCMEPGCGRNSAEPVPAAGGSSTPIEARHLTEDTTDDVVADLKHDLRNRTEDCDKVREALRPLYPDQPENVRAGWIVAMEAAPELTRLRAENDQLAVGLYTVETQLDEVRTERDADWDNAVDWLINSRYVDQDAATHFAHISTGQTSDCEWCREELKNTQWEK